MEMIRYIVILTRRTPLRIGFELLKQFENWENYDKAMEAYRYIDEIIEEGKKKCFGGCKSLGRKI